MTAWEEYEAAKAAEQRGMKDAHEIYEALLDMLDASLLAPVDRNVMRAAFNDGLLDAMDAASEEMDRLKRAAEEEMIDG